MNYFPKNVDTETYKALFFILRPKFLFLLVFGVNRVIYSNYSQT